MANRNTYIGGWWKRLWSLLRFKSVEGIKPDAPLQLAEAEALGRRLISS